MKLIDSKDYSYSDYNGADSFGNLHNTWNRYNAKYGGFGLYNLNKEYETFSGVVCASDKTHQNASMEVKIYCDDNLVWSKAGITRQTQPIPFEINVANASTLRIVTSDANDQYDSYVYIENSVLSKHIHTLGSEVVTKEAGCMDPGEKSWACTSCQEVIKTEVIPATGHTPDGKWITEVDATCEKEGKQVQHCATCKEICDTQKVDKLPHSPSDEWATQKEPACNLEGIQVKKCTVCNAVAEEQAIPVVDHSYGKWETISGSAWNNPIVKERTCSVCGEVEHMESNSTSWVKPLVSVLFIIIFGGIAVIVVTLKMNGLPLEVASVKKLFSKESLTDDDINDILNKPDDNK